MPVYRDPDDEQTRPFIGGEGTGRAFYMSFKQGDFAGTRDGRSLIQRCPREQLPGAPFLKVDDQPLTAPATRLF